MMKMPARRAVAPLFAATMFFALAACSSGSGPGVTSHGGGIEKGASLKVWLNGGPEAKPEQSLVQAWATAQGVHVSVQIVGSDQFQQSLQLAVKTGKAPDVWSGGDIRTMIKAGAALPLDGRLPADITEHYKQALTAPKAYIVGGKTYTVPLVSTTYRLLYNKDLFSQAGLDPTKPPTTISQVESDCQAIAAKGAYCLGVPLKYKGFVNKMIDEVIASTEDNLAIGGLFDLSQQKFVIDKDAPFVDLYRKAVANHWAYPGASSLDNDPMRSAFAQGKIAMYYGGSYDLPEMVTTYKTKINWAVAPNPVPDGTALTHPIMNQSQGYTVYAKTKYPNAAVALLAYLSGKGAVASTVQPGEFPVRDDVTINSTTPQLTGFKPTKSETVNAVSPGKVVDITDDTYDSVIKKLILGSGDIQSELNGVDGKYDKAYTTGLQQGTIDKSDYAS